MSIHRQKCSVVAVHYIALHCVVQCCCCGVASVQAPKALASLDLKSASYCMTVIVNLDVMLYIVSQYCACEPIMYVTGSHEHVDAEAFHLAVCLQNRVSFS